MSKRNASNKHKLKITVTIRQSKLHLEVEFRKFIQKRKTSHRYDVAYFAISLFIVTDKFQKLVADSFYTLYIELSPKCKDYKNKILKVSSFFYFPTYSIGIKSVS